MEFDFLQDCIDATVFTYEKMLRCTPDMCSEKYSEGGIIEVNEVSALISFTGDVIGSMIISMNDTDCLKTVSRLLYSEVSEIDSDALDGMEELINIIAGSAAARFRSNTGLGLPMILLGEKQRLRGTADSPWEFIRVKSDDLGEFLIGATLKEV